MESEYKNCDQLGNSTTSHRVYPVIPSSSSGLQLAPLYSNPRHQQERESIGDILNRYQGQLRPTYQSDYQLSNFEEESHVGFDEQGAYVGVHMSRSHQTRHGNARTEVGMQMSIGNDGVAISTSSTTSYSGGRNQGMFMLNFSRGSQYRFQHGFQFPQQMGRMSSTGGGLFSSLFGMFSPALCPQSQDHDTSVFGVNRRYCPLYNQNFSPESDGPIIEEVFDEDENDDMDLHNDKTNRSHLEIKEIEDKIDPLLGLGLIHEDETTYKNCKENVLTSNNSEPVPVGDRISNDLADYLMQNNTGESYSNEHASEKKKSKTKSQFTEDNMSTSEPSDALTTECTDSLSLLRRVQSEIQNTIETTTQDSRDKVIKSMPKEKRKYTKQNFKDIPLELKSEGVSLPFLGLSTEESTRFEERRSEVRKDCMPTLLIDKNDSQKDEEIESIYKNVNLEPQNYFSGNILSQKAQRVNYETSVFPNGRHQQSRPPQDTSLNPDKKSRTFDDQTLDGFQENELTKKNGQKCTYSTSDIDQAQKKNMEFLEGSVMTNQSSHSLQDLICKSVVSEHIAEAYPDEKKVIYDIPTKTKHHSDEISEEKKNHGHDNPLHKSSQDSNACKADFVINELQSDIIFAESVSEKKENEPLPNNNNGPLLYHSVTKGTYSEKGTSSRAEYTNLAEEQLSQRQQQLPSESAATYDNLASSRKENVFREDNRNQNYERVQDQPICENCLHILYCQHTHVHVNHKPCCKAHLYICHDCGNPVTIEEFSNKKHSAYADHSDRQYLDEHVDERSLFKDQKTKSTKSPVNKNAVPKLKVSRSISKQSEKVTPSESNNPTKYFADLVGNEGLVIKDVYPDGNCLFTAICDQLRIRGDFSYTYLNLRQAAVDYLRQHPDQEDGTPLLAFLGDDERSWEKYLQSMKRDGHWGDHLIIWALAHVLNRRIIIFSGNKKIQQTIIEPTGSLKNEKQEGSMTHSDEKSNDSSIDRETKEVLCAAAVTKQPVQNLEQIYLGHVSQSHYVSLRPKDWHKSLLEVLQSKETSSLIGSNPESNRLDCSEFLKQDVPSTHLTFAIKFIRLCDLIICKPCKEKPRDENRMVATEFYMEGFDAMSSMVLGGKYFGQVRNGFSLFIPRDTHVHNPESSHKKLKKDLQLDTRTSLPGFTKLTAIEPISWIKSLDGKYLKHLSYPEKSSSAKSKEVLAFYCDWPLKYEDWFTRKRKHNWPKKEIMEVVRKNGCRVTPQGDCCIEWKILFNNAEEVVSDQAVTEDQQDCFTIVKLFLENNLVKPLALQQMKHVFFYMCEETEEDVWKTKLPECMWRFFDRLKECLHNRNIPNYFASDINMLEDCTDEYLSECMNCIDTIQRHPFAFLYFICDFFSPIYKYVNEMFDKIVEDSMRISVNRDMNKSLRFCFLPVVAKAVCQLVDRYLYREALEKCKIAYEQLCALHGDIQSIHLEDVINEVIYQVARDLDHWLFAFFVDQELGTIFTETACEGLHTTSIFNYFGPFLADHLSLHTVDQDIGIPVRLVSPENLAGTTIYFLDILQNTCGKDVCTEVLEYFRSHHLDQLVQYTSKLPESSVPAYNLETLMRKL